MSSNSYSTADEAPIVLFDGLLIDGTGSAPIAKAVLIIEKNKITKAGTTKTVIIPDEAKIIHLKGKTIMPGLINAHVHRGYNEKNLKVWAQNGVTAVRDLAFSTLSVDWFKMRDNLLKDPMNARLVAVGPMITTPGGYPIEPFKLEAITVNNIAEATQQTENLLQRGADLIKIATEDGKYYFLPEPLPVLPTEIAAAITATTHRYGTKVTAHVTNPKLLPGLIEAGVDDLAHMVLGDLSNDIIMSIVKNDIYWVPTLELWYHIQKHPDAVAANFKPYDQAIENLNKFVNLGGKVALGTDYDGIPWGAPFDLGLPMVEIESMQRAGMTPMQIIVAATKHAAYVCNLTEKLGTLEVNKIADIIVIDRNPLNDLNHLKDISLVIHNGIIIRNNLKNFTEKSQKKLRPVWKTREQVEQHLE